MSIRVVSILLFLLIFALTYAGVSVYVLAKGQRKKFVALFLTPLFLSPTVMITLLWVLRHRPDRDGASGCVWLLSVALFFAFCFTYVGTTLYLLIRRKWRWFLPMFLVILLIVGGLCMPYIRQGHVADTKTYWTLPNGDTLIFYHSPSGSWPGDHPKNLDLVEKDGTVHHSQFGMSHSGYSHVELMLTPDKSTVWVHDAWRGQVGGSLNLKTKTFHEEPQILYYKGKDLDLFGVNIGGSTVLTPEIPSAD
ncbi:MAG: hypothetical protein ABI615_10770 [Chthoniobacterales bacterium]